jgi:hypothetical protein
MLKIIFVIKMCDVNPLLCNDREISNYTTTTAK